MEKIRTKLEWILDYYLVYFLYNPNKIERYNSYLRNKWDFGHKEVGISENEEIVHQTQSMYPHLFKEDSLNISLDDKK